jgi:hypothetical protein
MPHWLSGPGAVVPPSCNSKLEVETSVHAVKPASTADLEVANPNALSPVESIKYVTGCPVSGSNQRAGGEPRKV